MNTKPAIAVVGTFDTKAEEHIFLKDRIEQMGLDVLTVNVGTRSPSPAPVDLDLYKLVIENNPEVQESRDTAVATSSGLHKYLCFVDEFHDLRREKSEGFRRVLMPLPSHAPGYCLYRVSGTQLVH